MQLKVPNFDYTEHPVRVPPLQGGYEQSPAKVLIAGGGPVGLAMALALAKQGIRSVVIEMDRTVCVGSRAICLSRRSLEILDRLGVLGAFKDKGLPWTSGRSFYHRELVLQFAMTVRARGIRGSAHVRNEVLPLHSKPGGGLIRRGTSSSLSEWTCR